MNIRYGFEMTEEDIRGLFKWRSEQISKKTKLGKIRYVMNQLSREAMIVLEKFEDKSEMQIDKVE